MSSHSGEEVRYQRYKIGKSRLEVGDSLFTIFDEKDNPAFRIAYVEKNGPTDEYRLDLGDNHLMVSRAAIVSLTIALEQHRKYGMGMDD